jgi:hypothetical protein
MHERVITNRGSRKVTGWFPSWKLGRMIKYESRLERDYLFLLDYDPAVVGVRGQWPRVRYLLDDKYRTYWPDFTVERTGKRQIVEVKPAEKARKLENVRRFRAIRQVCLNRGYEFVLVTDEAIRAQPRLRNVKLLWRYSRVPVWPRHQLACQEFFGARAEASLGDLAEHLALLGAGRDVLYSMMFHGVLLFDLHRPVGPGARLWVAGSDAEGRAA